MEGFEGWDDYAPFYDWENARTLGRRDVPFWRNLALNAGGRVLELGSGTGRISLPLARAGVSLVGVDRSAAMLAFSRRRIARGRLNAHLQLVQADIRHLPFPSVPDGRRGDARRRFAMVMAPYGILQSLLHERDLARTLSEVHRVLQPNGTFGLELVADLPSWEEYRKRVSLRGWRGRRGGTENLPAIVGLATRTAGNRASNWALAIALHALLGLIAFGEFGARSEEIKLALFALGVVVALAAWKFAGVTGRIGHGVLVEALETGAKYALAVGAAAATVGIVIGVVTLTGVGFKISYIITGWAQAIAGTLSAVLPSFLATTQGLTLFAALVMTGMVCILMGCGIPTTANYIIMVTVAAPTLVQLGVQPLVAHFFVFYYGVLADITPPVALAAYAAAGMAGSEPFKTGNMAFRLGLAKVLVPFVFVFSPSLLLVAKGFTWYDFSITFAGCVVGIVALAAALSRFLLVELKGWEQLLLVAAALLLIVPGLVPSLLGLALAVPVVMRQLAARRAGLPAPA